MTTEKTHSLAAIVDLQRCPIVLFIKICFKKARAVLYNCTVKILHFRPFSPTGSILSIIQITAFKKSDTKILV